AEASRGGEVETSVIAHSDPSPRKSTRPSRGNPQAAPAATCLVMTVSVAAVGPIGPVGPIHMAVAAIHGLPIRLLVKLRHKHRRKIHQAVLALHPREMPAVVHELIRHLVDDECRVIL